MVNPNLPRDVKRKALIHLLSIAGKISAQATFYISTLGALSLILTNNDPNSLPPALATIAGGIGVNLLSNLIERLATNSEISEKEIIEKIQRVISESRIEQTLTKDEFRYELERFIGGQSIQIIMDLIRDGYNEVAYQLINQNDQFQLLHKEISSIRKILENSQPPCDSDITIDKGITEYLNIKKIMQGEKTFLTYRNALKAFTSSLSVHDLNFKSHSISALQEDTVIWFIDYLKGFAPATQSLYLTVLINFYDYLNAEYPVNIKIAGLRSLIRQRTPRQGQGIPYLSLEDIEAVLESADNLINLKVEDQAGFLRNLRDRAFLLTLADTGLRVHEACALRRGDVDWNESRAIIIGKGDKQAVIRFSTRSMAAIKDYLAVRSTLDGAAGKPLASLPLFARHDLGAGKKIKRITTRTGQNIVDQRVAEALGSGSVGSITPHSFRHYFVTMVLRGSGGNLKLAQELARHTSIAVTERYAHLSDDELDQGYEEIFN